MSCDKNKYNNQNNPQNQNSQNSGQPKTGKTSAEIAAEQWDSWLGNPDDHEITRNLNKHNINP